APRVSTRGDAVSPGRVDPCGMRQLTARRSATAVLLLITAAFALCAVAFTFQLARLAARLRVRRLQRDDVAPVIRRAAHDRGRARRAEAAGTRWPPKAGRDR